MNLMVGNPLTPYLLARGRAAASSASKWATLHRSSPSKAEAILVQTGSRDLQCPHHGAKKATRVPSDWDAMTLLGRVTGAQKSSAFPSVHLEHDRK